MDICWNDLPHSPHFDFDLTVTSAAEIFSETMKFSCSQFLHRGTLDNWKVNGYGVLLGVTMSLAISQCGYDRVRLRYYFKWNLTWKPTGKHIEFALRNVINGFQVAIHSISSWQWQILEYEQANQWRGTWRLLKKSSPHRRWEETQHRLAWCLSVGGLPAGKYHRSPSD